VTLVSVAPLKIPIRSELVLMLELVASKRGPAPVSDTEAGEPTVPLEGDATTASKRPLVCTLPNGFRPPRLSVVAES